MNQFSNFLFLQYDSVSTFQYLYTVNFSKNKPKALFLQLNKWLAFQISRVPGQHHWLQRMLLEADQKEEGKRRTKQIVEPDSDFWLFGHNTVTTHPEVGDRKVWMAQNSSQLCSVHRATYTK